MDLEDSCKLFSPLNVFFVSKLSKKATLQKARFEAEIIFINK